MLQAALDIMVEDGIRSVRNRAVARRAGVSLGSTTYHFKSIEDLIISAFQYWRGRNLLVDNPFYEQTSALLAPYGDGVVPAAQRAGVALQILELAIGYLQSQLSGKREDRLLELAFHHESVRYPALHELVMDEWQAQLAYLAYVHRVMGSGQPDVDAQITAALFRQLEQATVVASRPSPDMALIRQTLHRHMTLSFAVDLPLQEGGTA